jgi:hypothetical protein
MVSGVIWAVTIKGPGTIMAWCIYGTLFCALGWLFIAIPLIAMGRDVCRIPYWVLGFLGGIAGVLVMAAPGMIVRLFESLPNNARWQFSGNELIFAGSAFLIAATAVMLYRAFLRHSLDQSGLGG